MNLPQLIKISETSKLAKSILDKAVKKVYNNRKPLTEILNAIDRKEVYNEISKT